MREDEAPTVVIVGHVAIDTNRFPQGMIESAIGGAPTYAGLALAALGKRVGLVAKVGVDFTELFPPIFSRLGLDTEGLLVSGEHTTAFENIYDEWGNRTQLCRHVAPRIAPEDIPESYLGAKGFYISPLADEVPAETVQKVKRPGNLVMMDPQGLLRRIGEGGRVTLRSGVELQEFLRHVDVVKLGREEARLMMGEPEQLLRELCRMGPKTAILTHGREPVLVFSGGEFHEVESPEVEVRDPTGAGDVFGAVFLAKYIETGDVVESARFASAAAALKIRYKGPVGFPSEEEVYAAIRG